MTSTLAETTTTGTITEQPGRRPSKPSGPALRARNRPAKLLLASIALLAATVTWSCTDGSVGPVAPPVAEPDPGFLTVELTATAAHRDSGVLLELEGPGIDAVQAPGLELYESGASGRHQVILAGSLDAGPLLQFRVPDRNQLPLCRGGPTMRTLRNGSAPTGASGLLSKPTRTEVPRSRRALRFPPRVTQARGPDPPLSPRDRPPTVLPRKAVPPAVLR